MKTSNLLPILFWAAAPAVWADDAALKALAAAPATVAAPVSAVDGWTQSLLADLSLNQASFDNWKAGGTNYVSWQGDLHGKLERDNPGWNWLNTLHLAYGLTYLDGQGTRKSADTMDFSSVLAWKAAPQWQPYVSLAFLSQFDTGFDYSTPSPTATSGFMDPGYLTESLGVKYAPDPVFDTRLGAAVREAFADRFAAAYSDGKGVLMETGLNSVSDLDLKLSTDSTLLSKLDLFWNGQGLDRTVADWQNGLTVHLGKIVALTAEYDLRYDPAVYLGWQVKETLGIGVDYSLL
ncbi:MAG TPA: DUF3078 domain-containing protein [bacterium]|nr:DUF3078 domain-containing protein [bacterium]